MREPAEYQPKQTTKAPGPVRVAHLRQVAGEMQDELAACRIDGQPPAVEAVHHLRTGTRRVEATLETLAREAGRGGLKPPTEEARQRWLKQLKKVRRAAGEVRDLDVHRELLAKHYSGAGADPVVTVPEPVPPPRVKPLLVEQAHLLDRWLYARRAEAAQALVAALAAHARRLAEAEQRFLSALAGAPDLLRRKPRSAAQLALEDYLRLMDQMPHLEAANLHDFRKGAKKARYVAESDSADVAAQALAKAIKRVQDSIGDWHDLEVLAGEAAEALGNNGIALQADLAARTQKAYERALRLAATMGRRFIGEWQAQRQRKPARRAVTDLAASRQPRRSRA